MRKIGLVVAALLVTLAILYFFLPNDEKKIRRNLDLLAENCSTTSVEAAMAELQKAARAVKLCSDPCRVHVESFAITRDLSRKELQDTLLMMKKRLPHIVFSFHDTMVELPEKDRAEIVTTLSLTGEIGDDRYRDAYELHVAARKSDGNWVFSAFTVVEFMEQ